MWCLPPHHPNSKAGYLYLALRSWLKFGFGATWLADGRYQRSDRPALDTPTALAELASLLTELASLLKMHILPRWLTLMAFAAYLLVGGAAGLCTVWGGLGIQHHHHAAGADDGHSHDSAHATTVSGSICASDSSDCRKHEPTQPCRESADHDGDDFLALTPDSPAPITSPLVGDVPPPTPDFSAAPSLPSAAVPAHLLGSVRGSPARPPAVLCRFLV